MMTATFIAFFLIGSWCSFLHLSSPVSAIVGLVAFALFQSRLIKDGKRRLFIAAVLGFFWGGIHNESTFPNEIVDPSVLIWVDSASYLPSQKLRQVHNSNGQKLIVYRSSELLDQSVKCRRSLLGLAPFRCKLSQAGFDSSAIKFRSHVMMWLNRELPSHLAAWYGGLFLGDLTDFDRDIMQSFRIFGLFHIISVSGFHFSLLFIGVSFAMNLPLRLALSLTIFSNPGQRFAQLIFALLAAAVMVTFAWLLEFPQPCQRALFACVAQLINLQKTSLRLDPLKFAALGQMLFFPVGFWEASNLLSWGAYIIVVRATNELAAVSIGKLALEQFTLSIPALILVREFSILGLFYNVIFGSLLSPMFLVALIHTGLLWMRPYYSFGLDPILQATSSLFLFQIDFFAKVARDVVPYSWLILRPRENLLPVQIAALMLFACAVLLRCPKK